MPALCRASTHPQGTGRLPVVVLMHGSSGVGVNIEPWVQEGDGGVLMTRTHRPWSTSCRDC